MQDGQAPCPHCGIVSGNPQAPPAQGSEFAFATPKVESIFSMSFPSQEGQWTSSLVEKTSASKTESHCLHRYSNIGISISSNDSINLTRFILTMFE